LDIRHRNRRGFTLIELLVVVAVLGTLMAILLPNIFASQQDTQLFTCRKNLQNLYQLLVSYKNQHNGLWPHKSGVQFVLAVTQERSIYEPTEQNVGTFFCPAVKGPTFAEAVEDPLAWFHPGPDGKKLDMATSQDSDYAGRDMLRYGKGVGSSNMQPLICDDNEGGMTNHAGAMNVLFAGGQVQDFKFDAWIKDGLIAEGDSLDVPVGPDSPIKTKRVDLTKMRID
jgi:prepilin-type N-terminal cleavage/methylation domain-containing protein/prepilin-type processing-associated H-X9-DG protein